MKIKIRRYQGYSNPTYAWACPLCYMVIPRDLDKRYVKRKAHTHLVKEHNAMTHRLKIKVKKEKK